MKTTSHESAPAFKVDDTEDGYADLHEAVTRPISGPLFTTSAEGLFETFLARIPADRRQHYTCNACRRFIDSFGGLVSIGGAGLQAPAIWPGDCSQAPFFVDAIDAMRYKVARAKVTGVFLSSLPVWGVPITGPWRHLHVTNASPFKVTALRTASQAMAEKLEEHGMLQRALAEFDQATVEQAERLLKSETLYRSEKCLGVATWLLELHRARAGAADRRSKDNITWLAVATAPAGFCHVRSTVIGTLLEDIAAGLAFGEVSRRFAEKMNPLQYQRPTSAPSDANIARAEKVVGELAAAGSLRRRFARLSDVRALWTPTPKREAPPAGGGVFSHLKGRPAPARSIEIPPVTMTWDKFRRTVLPDAAEIACRVPSGYAAFSALVTACDPAAPPILQWDFDEARNPVSWYFYSHGSPASRWNLTAGAWARVTTICLRPSMWGSRPLANQGDGFFLLLEGARDLEHSGLALFPEILRGEFREVRKTIEAFSRDGQLEGADEADACGLGFDKSGRWSPSDLRVTGGDGQIAHYKLDRWD